MFLKNYSDYDDEFSEFDEFDDTIGESYHEPLGDAFPSNTSQHVIGLQKNQTEKMQPTSRTQGNVNSSHDRAQTWDEWKANQNYDDNNRKEWKTSITDDMGSTSFQKCIEKRNQITLSGQSPTTDEANGKQSHDTESHPTDSSSNLSTNTTPAPLTKQQLRQFETHLSNFGQKHAHMVQMTVSSQWMHRIQALYHLKSYLESMRSSTDSLDDVKLNAKLTSCADLLSIHLKDKVLKVFLVAVEIVEPLLRAAESLGSLVVRTLFVPVATALISQLANKSKKFVKETEVCFDYFCSQKLLGVRFVQNQLANIEQKIEEGQKKSLTILFTNQLQLLDTLIQHYGLTSEFDSSFDANRMLKFSIFILEQFPVDQQVKLAAGKIITSVYAYNSKLCNIYFRNLDAQILKYISSILKKSTNHHSDSISKINSYNLLQSISNDDKEDWRAVSKEEMDKLQSHAKALGLQGVLNLLSKKWDKRNDVLEHLRTLISSGNSIDISNSVLIRHLIEISALGLSDTHPPVFANGTKLLRTLFCENEYRNTCIDPVFIQDLLRKHTIGHVSSKIGHMNTHINKHCKKLLIDFAKTEKIGVRFVSDILLDSEQEFDTKQWKNIIGRLAILTELIEIHGFSNDGMSMERILTYVIGTFSSPNAHVRQEAVSAIVAVYKKAGNVIQTYLKNQKPILMKELRERIANEAQNTSNASSPINHLATIVRPFGFEDQTEQKEERTSFVQQFKSPKKKPQEETFRFNMMKNDSKSKFDIKNTFDDEFEGDLQDNQPLPLSSHLSSLQFQQSSSKSSQPGKRSRFVFS